MTPSLQMHKTWSELYNLKTFVNGNEENHLFFPRLHSEFLEMKEAHLISVVLWVQVQFTPSFYTLRLSYRFQLWTAKMQ